MGAMGQAPRRIAGILIVAAVAATTYAYRASTIPPEPVIAADAGQGSPRHPGALEVMYIANQGVLLSAGDDRVLIDGLHREYRASYPFLPAPHREAIERAQPPFDGVDVVLVSHRHLDHFHPESVGRYLDSQPQAVLVSSEQVVADLEKGYADFRRIAPRVRTITPALTERVATNVGGIDVVLLGVGHGSGRHGDVQNLGHIVRLAGRKVLHLGDASTEDRRIFEALRLREEQIDVAFLPVFNPPAARRWGHLHQPRLEPRQRLDEVALRGHHLVDVLVGHRHLVESGRQQRDVALAEKRLRDVPREQLLCLRPAHAPAGAVRRGVQRRRHPLAADDVARRAHRAGDDAEHAGAGGRRALAMDDDLALGAVGQHVPLAPREVVVVLDVEHE
jgi:L-ascorbate metabolism protein UlaG (beta-lactamase superfamily)